MIHPTAILNHNPEIGSNTSIGEYCVIQNHGKMVAIGSFCDIGERVSINCSDSHLFCIGVSDEIEYLPIFIEDYVYIGAGAIIMGGVHIGHHSVIGAGSLIQKHTIIPPYTLISDNLKIYHKGYYENRTPNSKR